MTVKAKNISRIQLNLRNGILNPNEIGEVEEAELSNLAGRCLESVEDRPVEAEKPKLR